MMADLPEMADLRGLMGMLPNTPITGDLLLDTNPTALVPGMNTSVSAVGYPMSASTPVNVTFTATPSMMMASSSTQKRRSSTRSIKRKKFDDELVESSLIKTDRGRIKIPNMDIKLESPLVGFEPPPPVIVAPEKKKSAVAIRTIHRARQKPEPRVVPPPPPGGAPPQPPPPASKPSSSKRSSKKSKMERTTVQPLPPQASTKDLGRWKPQDDLSLIINVQQTNDLTAVHLGVKFSCRFTLREIQERWYAILYDPVISKLAINSIKQLHPDIIAGIQAKALFSSEEETLLGSVTSTSQPSLDIFDDLLAKNPTVFHTSRTSKILYNHWLLMKQCHLLPDQSVQPMPRGDHVLNFSDAEDMVNDDELKDPRDEMLEHELAISDRRQKREIRHLEQELPRWQVLVDSVTGISPPDFDNQTLAVLRGRLVRYLMRSREITLGRATKDNPIDVDLSLEGPAWKISRRQGVIKLRSNGDFFIANEGKRPIFIDNKAVLAGNKQKLNNNSVVEISCLKFIFLINQDLISVIRAEAQRLAS